MQVVWGPWKLRTRRGMGITGMGGLLEPSTVHRCYRWSPLWDLLPWRHLVAEKKNWLLQEPRDEMELQALCVCCGGFLLLMHTSPVKRSQIVVL